MEKGEKLFSHVTSLIRLKDSDGAFVHLLLHANHLADHVLEAIGAAEFLDVLGCAGGQEERVVVVEEERQNVRNLNGACDTPCPRKELQRGAEQMHYCLWARLGKETAASASYL